MSHSNIDVGPSNIIWTKFRINILTESLLTFRANITDRPLFKERACATEYTNYQRIEDFQLEAFFSETACFSTNKWGSIWPWVHLWKIRNPFITVNQKYKIILIPFRILIRNDQLVGVIQTDYCNRQIRSYNNWSEIVPKSIVPISNFLHERHYEQGYKCAWSTLYCYLQRRSSTPELQSINDLSQRSRPSSRTFSSITTSV